MLKTFARSYTTIARAIASTETEIIVTSPVFTLDSGDYFYLDIMEGNTFETVKVVSVNSTTLGVVRGVGGTAACSFTVNAVCGLRFNNAWLQELAVQSVFVNVQLSTCPFDTTVMVLPIARSSRILLSKSFVATVDRSIFSLSLKNGSVECATIVFANSTVGTINGNDFVVPDNTLLSLITTSNVSTTLLCLNLMLSIVR